MKATLDHVGIAVGDLEAALAFYRDTLGLDVEPPEEVDTERVRVRFIPVGAAHLELIEATAPDSPVARFVERRGPGLHHITLRVDDLTTTLAALKDRGARLVDDSPRQGAEGSLVAFIHPSSTDGVLIELKQVAVAAPGAAAGPLTTRYPLGNLELVSLHDGLFRLDGGAMFGSVPKALWARVAPPDDRNRITMAMRPLLVRGARTMLIDAGLGDKEDERFREMYGVDRRRHLDHALAEAGVGPEDIDIVLATHLHFDHAGGFTMRDRQGRLRPRFPRARYVIRRGEWEDATHPHERNRASYRADNFLPLMEAGVVEFVDEDQTIMPGVRVRHTGGHAANHQIVTIESGGRHAAFLADLIPTAAHVTPAWIMGYDLFPMETLAVKKAFLEEAASLQTLVFLEHDPIIAAGYVRGESRKPAFHPCEAETRA